MKNFRHNFLTAVTILSLGFLFSCGEDDTPLADAPGVTVSAAIVDGDALVSGGEVVAGSAVEFSISVTAPGGFNNVDITGSTTQNINRNDLNLDLGATSASTTLTVSTAETDAGGTASFTFVAVDELNQSSEEVVFTFDIVAPPSPDAQVISQILVAPPTGDADSDTFYSIGENTLYSHNDVIGTNDPVSADIDLGYYYGSNDMASLAAPSAYPAAIFDISAWGTKNATQIEATDLSTEAFTALTSVADVDGELANVTFDGNIATALSVGDILAFKTVATPAVSGFIHVVAITGTSGSNDSIELEFILNQEGQ